MPKLIKNNNNCLKKALETIKFLNKHLINFNPDKFICVVPCKICNKYSYCELNYSYENYLKNQICKQCLSHNYFSYEPDENKNNKSKKRIALYKVCKKKIINKCNFAEKKLVGFEYDFIDKYCNRCKKYFWRNSQIQNNKHYKVKYKKHLCDCCYNFINQKN
jgi:hypothetical protein